jgi:gliding motility-associated-like protein
MRKLILSIFILSVASLCAAQTDTAFWFAAPDLSSSHGYDRPVLLRITSYQQACTVTIAQPAGGGLPSQTFSMPANTTQSVDLTTWINNIECTPGDIIQNKGIKITADYRIAVYYDANANGPNPEFFALKGRNAVGNEFYISSQYILGNSPVLFPLPTSAFNIVATENNTSVTITPSKAIVGHAAGVPFSIILNRGQTYSAVATSQAAAQHLQGSHVTSTKPVAITLSDDLLQGLAFGGACEDLAGDQTVPVNIIGNEYIAIKSNLNAPFDKLYITATQNATSISQDGVAVITLNAGQSAELTVSNNSTYIQSSAPVYAYQLSGIGCEVGSALLPKLNCTGSSSVSITRSTTDGFILTLLVKNGGQNNFLVNGAGGVITAGQFAVVPATGGLWYAAKVTLPLSSYPNGSVIRVTNSTHIFQLGVLQGGSLGVGVGYFSDFNSLQAHAFTSTAVLCNGAPIQLSADLIGSATYGWTGPNGFISNVQNPTIPNSTVLNSGMYHLTVTVPGCGTYLDSVAVLVNVCSSVNCDTWLQLPSFPSSVSVGDLDVTGNQLTVEALFSSTTALNPTLQFGKLVSKHTGASDVNYSLMGVTCEITTTNGYVNTPVPCTPLNDKVYHVAMVYNGSVLKFYRNGFLLSSIPWTGNLVNNNWLTTIGSGPNNPASPYQQLGYINEVRIWNVARTQAQLQANINSSLPNPTTQTGLLGYYSFDNLLNKQGNAAFNGTLNGGASINATNPNCNFLSDSCNTIVSPCNFWPAFNANSYTTSVPNNTLTFSLSNASHLVAPTPYSSMIPGNWFMPNPTIGTTSPPNAFAHNTGDLGAIGINPVISNETGTINFTNPTQRGFYLHVYQTISRIDFDKSFTLVSSDGDLHVGNSGSLTNNVLIPDVIQSQSPDDANATIYFPAGTSQVNFTLTASPSSPTGDGIKFAFTFPEDCITNILPTISGIINDYTAVLGLDICKNILTVGDASKYNPGDTVLLIQMKGAVIDSTNTATFGNITNYKNAGNYEFNYVKSKTGNNIELKNVLTKGYDLPNGKVQLVRVPYYQNPVISSTLTCQAWNGSTGGILVLNAADTVILNADIDVKGKGFRGAFGFNNNLPTTSNCNSNQYTYPLGSILSGNKGESITSISNNITGGKGNLASAGGAGLDHNGGAGGGGNGGDGGFGGYQLDACGNAPFDNRGIGGKKLVYNNVNNKIFAGAGGGSGQANNAGTIPGGGNGGGIIIINALKLKNTGAFKIIANGDDANTCTPVLPNISCHDGMGGGGSGGTVLLNVPQLIANTTIEQKGGKGADMTGDVSVGGKIGAGGGGGGGVLWVPTAILNPNITSVSNGGAHGVLVTDGNSTWGTTDGQQGINLFNLQVPIDNVPFKINIDSVRFNFAASTCNSINFFGLAYINSTPVATWQWYFGDGGTSGSQNSSHTYGAPGVFTVKLVVTDNNGCKDSILKPVTIAGTTSLDFIYKQDICNPLSVQFAGNSMGTSLLNPYWSFGDASTFTGTTTSSHVYAAPGNYLVRFTVDNQPCNDTISKMITVGFTQADIVITPDTTICFGTSKLLRALPSDNFCWSPTTFLTNSNSATPTTAAPQAITYYYTSEVTGTNLVVNGDFNTGNTGFTSSYNYTPVNTAEGQYFIGAFPSSWNPIFSNCAAHGGSAMMMVNGATTPGTVVWKESLNVTPNTNYVFSAWISSISATSPAQLRFSINGISYGNNTFVTASQPPCTWTQFHVTWNSGNNISASLSIDDNNLVAVGNDFILDDIIFAPVSIKRDSVKITVDKPTIAVGGTILFCYGVTGVLIANGSAGMNSYSWSPATGLSNANIFNPTVTMLPGTALYTVTGTTVNGCSTQASISVTVMPKPSVTLTPDTTICFAGSIRLVAGGGTDYSWTPAATLSNPSIPDPIATPIQPATKYYVTVYNYAVNACSSIDSVTVSMKPLPSFTISPAKTTCQGTAVQLVAGGGNKYAWSPPGLVSNPAVPNPFTTANTTTNYSVLITDSVCNISKTLATVITINPSPQVTASKSNDITCAVGYAELLASGATEYTWTPATGLSSTIIANPVALPGTTTQYIVTGTNGFGCADTGMVTVAVAITGKGGYYMPNTFTPNGDGKNDCFGIKNWGFIEKLEFFIYNRYGEKVFYTTDPNGCWNGKYKSDKPEVGNYVYYIKAKMACGEVERKGNVILIR